MTGCQLHASEIRAPTRGDRHVLAHLAIPDAVRLNVYDSSYWYYDAGSRTLHEWSCSCRSCAAAWRAETPSHRCKFRRKYTAHASWPEVDESDLTTV